MSSTPSTGQNRIYRFSTYLFPIITCIRRPVSARIKHSPGTKAGCTSPNLPVFELHCHAQVFAAFSYFFLSWFSSKPAPCSLRDCFPSGPLFSWKQTLHWSYTSAKGDRNRTTNGFWRKNFAGTVYEYKLIGRSETKSKPFGDLQNPNHSNHPWFGFNLWQIKT